MQYHVVFLSLLFAEMLVADEPPVINPFGAASAQREDARPGYVELSDGKICAGQVYLTRDARLKISDERRERQREVPLTAVKQIECKVKKEWMEKEWKFKELTKDEKMYTGRTYPSREYMHTITLSDDRTITGELSAIVYVDPPFHASPKPGEIRPQVPTEKFLLHKRDKGEIGKDLKSLVYVKSIKLGKEAFEEGMKKINESGTISKKKN
ncbi:MAG: hypothetical protein IT426_07035 [Pirellulales bacterium]|nr:hypothetical protein [Pirellulales bacterium]